MENIKCVSTLVLDDIVVYYFKIPESIAELVRKHTSCPKEDLWRHLDDENEYKYVLSCQENQEEFDKTLIETIERISNEGDEEFLLSHVISNNGQHKFPAQIHEQMENEYGLSGDMEWWVAHFFIGMSSLIFDPPFCYGIDDDTEIARFEIKLCEESRDAILNTLKRM